MTLRVALTGALFLSLPIGVSPCRAQAVAPTAAELVARIQQRTGVPVPDRTVDTFKAGEPATRVTGIAVTMMATLDVLQRAAAKGHNLIITHEPTFYSHRDTVAGLQAESDPVFAAKEKFIREKGIVVWRFHDLPHAMSPDLIHAGTIRALGWENRRHAEARNVFDIQPVAMRDLGAQVGRKLGAGAVRLVGDPSARVSRVGITHGFAGFAASRRAFRSAAIDVMIIGEDHEWEMIEYAADAITAGLLKGMIVLGHVPSEQAGMQEVARWLSGFVTEVPVEFIATRDPFVPVR